MELEEEARNFCRLVLLLLKVGKPKIRQFFISRWNAVKGHQLWTDCEKNGQDLLRLFTNPLALAHELDLIKSGNTLEWNLPLVIKVLLHLKRPLSIKKGRIKALNYLGELREEVGRKHETVIRQPEFEKKWDDACTALSLFGARSRDFKETKRDMKQHWDQFYPFLKDVASNEKDILELLPTLQQHEDIVTGAGVFTGDIPCSSRLPSIEHRSLPDPFKSDCVARTTPFGLEYKYAQSTPEGLDLGPSEEHKYAQSYQEGRLGFRPSKEHKYAQSYPEMIAGHPSKVSLTHRKGGNEYYMFSVDAYSSHRWQFFDVFKRGIFLEVPPGALFDTLIKCSVLSDFLTFLPSPVGESETLVGYIVELKGWIRLDTPVIVTLPHSGADKSLGYETVVKAFDEDKMLWRELEEYIPHRKNPYVGTNSIQVLANIPTSTYKTTLAVVTRLITDLFQVTPKGCVVSSSVCDDVTIEFPEGAVDKTVEGTMKLMLMPENIHHTKDACPILCVDGFSNITFSKPVIVKMPIPDNTAEYSTKEIRLLLLEDNKWEDNEWRDVTHEAHILQFKTHLEFHVKHFSCLWPWMSGAKMKFASTIFGYLRSPPRAVCFAAFKDNEEASLLPKLTLVCVANHKRYETVSNMKDEGYSRLAVATGDRRMRPNDKAYLRVNGADMKIESFFLRFLKEEVCSKELSVHDTGQDQENLEEVVLNFFPNPEEKFDLLLGTLRMSKDMLFLRRAGERQSSPLAYQPQVEEEAQPLEGAVANPRLLSSDHEEEEDEGIRDLVSSFGKESLVNLDPEEVAVGLPLYLGVDRTLIADPPHEIMQRCQQFCHLLKNNGRQDIVRALRDELPSGMTGPLLDGNILVKDLDHKTKLKLSRALSVTDKWQTFAENIEGMTPIDIKFYSAKKDNPVLEILDAHCDYMKIDTLYRLIVESEANAIADFL